jgi:hypothetical protein
VSNKINARLGLKPAGKRRMMQLPKDRAAAAQVTAAVCPGCARRGATESNVTPGALWCTWCARTWIPTEGSEV